MAARKNQRLTARKADKLRLYEQSVQAPEIDARFMARHHQRATGEPARWFREDFCGTAILACNWVKLHQKNRAVGVDLHRPTLDWGRQHNLAELKKNQRARIELIEADVRKIDRPKVDVCCALNFSYSVFKTRRDLGGYFEHARKSLKKGGLLFIDAWGGSEVQAEQEEARDVDGFTYIWDQHSFDPVTHDMECRIHFEFKDGTRLRNAFTYQWRLWSLPELRELMTEAGFKDVHVLWEGTDHGTGEGNGVFRRVNRGEADAAWIAYVVGRR